MENEKAGPPLFKLMRPVLFWIQKQRETEGENENEFIEGET